MEDGNKTVTDETAGNAQSAEKVAEAAESENSEAPVSAHSDDLDRLFRSIATTCSDGSRPL